NLSHPLHSPHPSPTRRSSDLFAFLGGLGITFGAASAAFSNVLLKSRRMDLAPAMMAAWQMIFGTVPLLVIGWIVDGNPARFHWKIGRAHVWTPVTSLFRMPSS